MLALVGSGEYLPGMDPVDRYLLAQLEGEPRVVVLPTAAGTEGPERIEYWMDLGVQHFSGLGVPVEAVEIVTRAHAHEPRLVEPILSANFVYLSGGKPEYLYKVLEGTKTWEAILALHQRGGVVAGCSAGAMIMGTRVLGMLSSTPGFDLLPETVIMPHFDEFGGWMRRLARMQARQYRLVGVDGDTALVVHAGEERVVGSRHVTVIESAGERIYAGGEIIRGGKTIDLSDKDGSPEEPAEED
ncbi:MAG: cyanophycinase [Anaerolineales bacterium]|jgi:cyanophycinase